MKRLVYSSVESDGEYGDSFDSYDPYHGSKYIVYTGYTSKRTNSPLTAIKYWFSGQRFNPQDCAIMAKYKDDAIKLLSVATPELLENLNIKYPCPYKLDWMIEVIERNLRNNCSGFLGDGDLGDQVSPFTYG